MNESATLADYDREIERLTGERERVRKLLDDPVQRRERELLRERLVGRCVMDLIRGGDKTANTWLPLVTEFAGTDAWVFQDDVLRADGYAAAQDGKGGHVWSQS